MILGSTPTTAELMIFALELDCFLLLRFQKLVTLQRRPSFNPDALPAVTEPFLNAGFSLARTPREVLGLINSSLSKIIGSPFFVVFLQILFHL